MDKYIGKLLDNRYEILEVIGTGGMAVVYKARCHRLNRLVAIKILKDDYLEDEDFRRRFHSESQAVAMLSHPNIVSVYDVSTSVSVDYIVMELIEGISLKQYMEKKGVLNWKETLHFAMQIGKALEHAHSRGIVHRDIKPHNVMVLKNGSVKVTDFGIARLMSKSNTLTKEALGSVHYISPEQAKGGQVDDRSDIYSLGVVMYEMMSGRPPYDGETPVSVAIQHINGGAAMPSTMNPNIPGGLEQIIMKAMANDRAKRFAGATEMLRDMDEFRKDPAMLFDYNGNADEVIYIHRPVPPVTAAPAAATPARAPAARTNAERAVDKANGVSAAKRARDREAARRRKAEEERRRNRVAVIAISICAAVMILAVVVVLIVFLGNDSTMVEVPPLVGQQYRKNMTVKGLVIGEPIWEPSEEPAGTILKQDPRSGTEVKPNTVLHLTVSQGPSPIQMSSLRDYTETQAKAHLDDLGLDLDIKVEYIFHDAVEKNCVAYTDPEAGVELTPGQKITLFVSRGEQPSMDDLEGFAEEYARKLLDSYELKLKIVTEEEYSEEFEKGRVIRTEPGKGELLEEGQEILLVISKGEIPAMPDLEGLPQEFAIQQLEDLEMGLDVLVEYENSADVPEGSVIRTDPVAESELTEEQKVTLYVSEGAEVVMGKVPNIIGMTLQQAQMALTNNGFNNYQIEYKPSMETENQVIDQSVSANTEADVTTKIVITLSDGSVKEKTFQVPLPTQADLEEIGVDKDGENVQYELTVCKGNTILYSVKFTVGQESVSVTLIDSGTQSFELKIDGQSWKYHEVIFS